MVYTAKTFSDCRYELWNCRAMYHNVPIIGGHEQQAGAQYAARDVQEDVLGMALDLAAAYPAEAGVLQCRRSFQHDIPPPSVSVQAFSFMRPWQAAA